MAVMVNMPDGSIVPPERATVSVFDRSFLFGDSVYETLRTYDGRPFAMGTHLKRMRASLARLRLRLDLDDGEVVRRIEETIAAAGNPESYVRPIISRGVGAFGLPQGLDTPGELYVIVRPLDPLSPEAYARGIAVIVPKVRRNPPEALDPALKTGNYLNGILAMIEAREAGADDAVMLNVHGNVTEASTANLFAVFDGVLTTPPLHAGILEGVTRGIALEAARAAGIPAIERDFDADEFRGADEAFVTSTLKEVLPIRTVDGEPLRAPAPGPLATRLRALVSERILALHRASV